MKNFFSKKEKKTEFLRQLKTLFIPISRTQKTRQIRQIGGKRIESVRARPARRVQNHKFWITTNSPDDFKLEIS